MLRTAEAVFCELETNGARRGKEEYARTMCKRCLTRERRLRCAARKGEAAEDAWHGRRYGREEGERKVREHFLGSAQASAATGWSGARLADTADGRQLDWSSFEWTQRTETHEGGGDMNEGGGCDARVRGLEPERGLTGRGRSMTSKRAKQWITYLGGDRHTGKKAGHVDAKVRCEVTGKNDRQSTSVERRRSRMGKRTENQNGTRTD
ncbi:hypothetical protein ERJ75_000152400 [Trypanosoma vivax]|nr:hypothetical protein ERJ75_000152400 [Trypanosoma vivax]